MTTVSKTALRFAKQTSIGRRRFHPSRGPPEKLKDLAGSDSNEQRRCSACFAKPIGHGAGSVVGAMLPYVRFDWTALGFLLLLFVMLRPPRYGGGSIFSVTEPGNRGHE